MSRVNLLLLLAVVLSCLVLVKAAHDTRRLRYEIHRAELETERLDGERKLYEAERQQQATSVRVDRAAREKLGMATISPAVTLLFDPNNPAAGLAPLLAASAVPSGARR